LAGQIDRYPGVHRAGIQSINPGATFDIRRVVYRVIANSIVAGPAVNDIIARSAIDSICQAVANKSIVAVAAQDIFKILVLKRQVYANICFHRAGIQGVNPGAALDIRRVVRSVVANGIVAGPAVNDIIARSAIDSVCQIITDKSIVAAAAL